MAVFTLVARTLVVVTEFDATTFPRTLSAAPPMPIFWIWAMVATFAKSATFAVIAVMLVVVMAFDAYRLPRTYMEGNPIT